jgi:hypothetical protein
MAHEQKFVIEKTDTGIKGSKAIRNAIDELSNGRWVVTIAKYKKKRSNNQNRFYFGNFIASQIECFQERWGETYRQEQVHDWNKANFWADSHINEDTGEVIMKPASSTDNNTIEWEEKLEKIRQWFRQNMDWELPFPLQQTEIDL